MELPIEGDVVAGKYTLERTLGAGAMGVVMSAVHSQLGERVALKFLQPEMAKNAEVVERFLREAQSAARIRGDHVGRVTDVGTLPTGIPYLVMEYLDGTDLGVWIEKRGALSVSLAVELVLQACTALAEAHAIGIVHRDLKPANLFVATRSDGSPLVKVLDFGIAKLTKDSGRAQLTALGAVMGSPLYMSPELLSNAKGVDARSDVWQVGTILYEALTGKPAFDGHSLNEVIIAIGTKSPPSLRALRPDVPQAIETLILRCLERVPAARLPDVAAIAEGLAPFATTRRAQVTVEHTVLLARGAGATLPAMPAPHRTSAALMNPERRSVAPGPRPSTEELAATVVRTPESPAKPSVAAAPGRLYLALTVAAALALGVAAGMALRGSTAGPALAAPPATR